MTILMRLVHTTFFLLLCTIPALASTGTDGVQTRLFADDLAIVQAGETVYRAHCASCHGVYLEGQKNWRDRDAQGYLPAPPHDATGHTWHHADDLLFEITKYGPAVVIGNESYLSRMPAYKDLLSDEEIIAVLSFIKNSWPAEEREWQESVNATAIDPSPLFGGKKSTILDRLSK